MFVQGDFHLELFLFDAAIFLGEEFVDEFDGKDRDFFLERSGFLDTKRVSERSISMTSHLQKKKQEVVTMHMLQILL